MGQNIIYCLIDEPKKDLSRHNVLFICIMHVLSYNVYYMSTLGTHPLCQQKMQTNLNICMSNIIQAIDANGPYDFVGLQEATNWDIIQNNSLQLKNMKHVFYNPGGEDMITFYDAKYQLDDTSDQITGNMADTGRPFIVLFFKGNLCVINLHAGHAGDIYKFDDYLEKTLRRATYSPSMSDYLLKLQTYDIIMMGDCNDPLSISNTFDILNNPFFKISGGRKLYGINKTPTWGRIIIKSTDKMSVAYDHILSTNQNISTQVLPILHASDHFPIMA